jgi:hypothetical protein
MDRQLYHCEFEPRLSWEQISAKFSRAWKEHLYKQESAEDYTRQLQRLRDNRNFFQKDVDILE